MAEPSQVANQMLQILQNNPTRVDALKADPLPEFEKLKAEAEKVVPAYINDRFLYRVAVFVLGLLTIIAAVGSIILVLVGKTTPEVLVALGSAAIGALVGLFAPSPTGK
jgi:hypothetical protein